MSEIIDLVPSIDPLHLEVRGSEGITFSEGWMTGDMTKGGIEIDTVWYAESRASFGGCIDRNEARALHEFLTQCIEKWDAES
jgi:hypothetical protein